MLHGKTRDEDASEVPSGGRDGESERGGDVALSHPATPGVITYKQHLRCSE